MSTYIQLSLNIYIYLYSYIGTHFCNSRNKTFRTRVCMCLALLNKTKSFFYCNYDTYISLHFHQQSRKVLVLYTH